MILSGVYAIECFTTGERYVGSAVNICRRWERHRYELRHGKHHSWKLQRAWKKQGEESFRFFVLAETIPEDLVPLEQRFIDEAASAGTCLNVLLVAGKGAKGYKHTAESIKKRSEALLGHKVSEDTRKKLRDKALGRKDSEATREAKRAVWERKKSLGLPLSDKVLASRASKKVSIERVCPKTGAVVGYASIKEVRRDGFISSCVSNCLAGRHQSHKGFWWKYENDAHV